MTFQIDKRRVIQGMTIRILIFFLPLFVLLFTFSAGVSDVRAGIGAPSWSDLAWSPDGSLLAAVGASGLALFTPDLIRSETADIFPRYFYYGKVAWSPDGEHLAVKEQPYGYYPEGKDRYSLSVWSITPLAEIDRLESGNGREIQPLDLEWQPDGSAVLTEVGGKLQTVDPLTMASAPVPISLPHPTGVRYLGFNRDITQAAYILDNQSQQTVRMYGFDLATGTLEWEVDLDDIARWNTVYVEGTVPIESFPLDNIAWSSDGQIAISGNFLAIYTPADDSLRLLNATSESLIHHIKWSPDGRYLAVVVGKEVEIWDAVTAERVEVTYTNTETTPTRNPYALAWHPDGMMLVVSRIHEGAGDGAAFLSFDMSHLYEDP